MRVAVLMADGFEMAEYTIPVNALRTAGAKTSVVSLRHGRIRGVNLHEPAHKVRAHLTVDEAKASDYDALFIPGGFVNPDLLRQSRAARDFVTQFDKAEKPIATLCHGPWVLASAGLLKQGRTLTSWPGIRALLEFYKQPAIRQHRFPTEQIHKQSSPQRDEAPQVVLAAMKWLPRPSFRVRACDRRMGGGLRGNSEGSEADRGLTVRALQS